MSFMMLSFLMYSDGNTTFMDGECGNNMIKDYVIFFYIIGAIVGLVLFAKFGLGA